MWEERQMKKIVSAEMYKVRHNLSFFVSMIASVPLGALFTIVMCLVPEVTMPDIISGVVSYYKIFFIVMIAMYVTNDYEKGTIKAIVSSGVSKSRIYFGRLLVSIVISELMFLMSAAGAWICAVVRNVPAASGGQVWGAREYAESIVIQMLAVVLYAMVGYFISVILRKQVISIMAAVFILYFEPMAAQNLGKIIHADLSILDFSNTVVQMEELNITGSVLLGFAIFIVIVGVLTCIIGTEVFKRRDI